MLKSSGDISKLTINFLKIRTIQLRIDYFFFFLKKIEDRVIEEYQRETNKRNKTVKHGLRTVHVACREIRRLPLPWAATVYRWRQERKGRNQVAKKIVGKQESKIANVRELEEIA